MPPVDHFPSTHATWLDAQLTLAEDPDTARAGAARSALHAHIMERYHEALCAYVRTAAFARLGEPAELVDGFLAKQLPDHGFLRRWRESGMPLRRWLMNAVAFHCRGLMRDAQRERGRTAGLSASDVDAALAGAASREPDAARAFDRAWAVALANEAHAIARADADERGRPADYLVFRMHVVEGMEYDAIAPIAGLTPTQCKHAAGRVGERMRQAVRDLLRAEGVPVAELDAAVAELMALIEDAGR